MTSIETKIAEMKAKPILVGLFAVLATMSVGMTLAIATGMTDPIVAYADGIIIAPPCDCGGPIIPPVIPPVIIPPIIIPPVIIPPPVLPPASCTLTASLSAVHSGEATTLSWNASLGTSWSIDNGIGALGGDVGSITVSPTTETTYTMTVTGQDGGTVNCTATVTIIPPTTTPPPTCTANVAASVIRVGDKTMLSWNVTNASLIVIDNNIGTVSAVGSVEVAPILSTTYTVAALGNDGSHINCTARVTTTITNPPPTCTATVDASTIQVGTKTLLRWNVTNASMVVIDNGIGIVGPTGFVEVSPILSTTYVVAVKGNDGSNTSCTARVNTSVNPVASCDAFTASATNIHSGDKVTLAWRTTNATGISINQNIGNVTPVAVGSYDVNPTSDTTYTATVTGPGGPITCSAPVHIIPVTNGPSCSSLTADKTSIKSGDAVTLTWATNNASSISIDNGVGSQTPVSGGTVVVNPTSDTTYTATVNGSITNDSCKVTIRIETTSCQSGCGGGGGGHPKPKVVLSTASSSPLAFVYLSQVPYTGLDLGPVGTVIYWIVLIAWSAAAAYLVLFSLIPSLGKRIYAFGEDVRDVLNTQEAASHTYAVRAPASPVHDSGHDLMPHAPVRSHAPVAEVANGYSTYHGFRSYASGDALSIDDIVKGISREPVRETHIEPQHVAAPVQEASVAHAPAHAPARAMGAEHAPQVRGFLAALIEKDKEAVFGALRQLNRGGGDVEHFLMQATHALDDVFRSRIDGSAVDPEMARICINCDTPLLERLVSQLSSAIDSSYTAGTTGAKLALSRALVTLGA